MLQGMALDKVKHCDWVKGPSHGQAPWVPHSRGLLTRTGSLQSLFEECGRPGGGGCGQGICSEQVRGTSHGQGCQGHHNHFAPFNHFARHLAVLKVAHTCIGGGGGSCVPSEWAREASHGQGCRGHHKPLRPLDQNRLPSFTLYGVWQAERWLIHASGECVCVCVWGGGG
jgi:hypothetical protein